MNKPHHPSFFKAAATVAQGMLDTDALGGDIAYAYLELLRERGLPPVLKCGPQIQLVNGEYFDFTDPGATKHDPESIAHALSKIARFNGHALGDTPYVVAQHLCLAAEYAPKGFKFEALMHDAPEYVLGDVTTPLKQLMPDYQRYEDMAEEAFARQFGLPLHMSPEVKLVDLRMAATERRDLLSDTHDEWDMLKGIEPYADKITPWGHAYARTAWLHVYNVLNIEYLKTGVLP